MAVAPRHEWYQTDAQVVLSVLVRAAQPDSLKVHCTERSLSIEFDAADTHHRLHFPALAHPVDAARVQSRALSTKVEVKLAKLEQLQWSQLETADVTAVPIKPAASAVAPNISAAPASGVVYPSSSRTGAKNWDAIGRQAEEEEEKPEGDAALNGLFQKIFKDGTDEQKKAMMKSFQESGGTVLSTNWDEVNKNKVEVKPPDGMEYKQW